jgi:hypothetical protein
MGTEQITTHIAVHLRVLMEFWPLRITPIHLEAVALASLIQPQKRPQTISAWSPLFAST